MCNSKLIYIFDPTNKPKPMKYTIDQFRKDYPNDAVCLDKIFKLRYGNIECCPGCGVVNPEFKRITTRRSYQCRECYYQVYPTAGTVFEKTRTPLTYWFYAMYLMTVTRNGVSAKELERVLGVTYKTAFRMAHCIRDLMKENQVTKLTGFVEMDETYSGGRTERKSGRNNEKTVVFAMVQRLGNVIAKQVPNAQKTTLFPIIEENVSKEARVSTDEFAVYVNLHELGYEHRAIKHQMKQYRNGSVSTNTVEGFFSQLKRMIFGTHIHISKKHFTAYLNECSFRYNNRYLGNGMFNEMLMNLPIFSLPQH